MAVLAKSEVLEVWILDAVRCQRRAVEIFPQRIISLLWGRCICAGAFSHGKFQQGTISGREFFKMFVTEKEPQILSSKFRGVIVIERRATMSGVAHQALLFCMPDFRRKCAPGV